MNTLALHYFVSAQAMMVDVEAMKASNAACAVLGAQPNYTTDDFSKAAGFIRQCSHELNGIVEKEKIHLDRACEYIQHTIDDSENPEKMRLYGADRLLRGFAAGAKELLKQFKQ